MDEDLKATLERLTAGATQGPAEATSRCGLPAWLLEDKIPTGTYCDGGTHIRVSGSDPKTTRRYDIETVGRCPAAVSDEIAKRYSTERARLKGPIDKLVKQGGEGFEGFDARRHRSAAKALEVMQAFAADPAGANVFLFGPTGLGKTRLMLASHFALLRRGVNSRYVTSPELRSLFRRKESFDEDAAKEANDALLALQGAAVIHADDLGDIEGDERKKGGFAEGLKDLLRLARGTWVFSTNCGYAELKSHPDIGAKNLSRMVEGATLVPMEGKDFRVQTAKVAK